MIGPDRKSLCQNLMHRSHHREPSHSDDGPYLMTAIAQEEVQEEDSFQVVRHGRRARPEVVLQVIEHHVAVQREATRQVAIEQMEAQQDPEADIQAPISNRATGFTTNGLVMARLWPLKEIHPIQQRLYNSPASAPRSCYFASQNSPDFNL
jgi:hypothetical protein